MQVVDVGTNIGLHSLLLAHLVGRSGSVMALAAYDVMLRQMMTADPLQPVLARVEEVLQSGQSVFLAGTLAFPDAAYPLPSLPPAYRDAGKKWHVTAHNNVWQLQAGQLLHVHATRGQHIEVPIPGQARVQGYENLELRVAEGWR
jgi:hypothetical protein